MPARTRIAQLIARQEGFGVPGALPTRTHNPGDLTHAPGITAWDHKIGIEPNDEEGWADLERQLTLYAQRGLTIRQMVSVYAPPNENDTQMYLLTLCDALGCDAGALISDLLSIPAEGVKL